MQLCSVMTMYVSVVLDTRRDEAERKREREKSVHWPMATFLITTPLLPSLLVAPPERESIRSQRIIMLTRHIQRILDPLPSAAQVPKTQERSQTVPVVNSKLQTSNIVAVSVNPSIGRVDSLSRISYLKCRLDRYGKKDKLVGNICMQFFFVKFDFTDFCL